MSDFAYQPAPSAPESHEPRVLVAAFGDGYEQRVADGINNDLETFDLVFNRATADIDTIMTFLAGKGAATAFTWTPDGGSEITVVCPSWQRIRTAKGVQGVAARFRRVLA
jgi:phage-related protein